MNINFKPLINNPKLVWLDTNVVINIKNALKTGDKQIREYRLYTHLKKLVSEGKILCPIMYQRDEYIEYHNDQDKGILDEILLTLSKGKKATIVFNNIHDIQFERMLKVFKEKGNEFWFEDKDIFLEQKPSSKDLLIDVVIMVTSYKAPNQGEIDNKLLDDFKRRKEEISKIGLSFEQTRKSEMSSGKINFNTPLQDLIASYIKFNPQSNIINYQGLVEAKEKLLDLEKRMLSDTGLNLNHFYDSEHFDNLPIDDIHTRLVTSILFSSKEPTINDIKDLKNISVALPYIDFAITDRAMKGHLYKTGLNNKYDTKIYSLDDTERVINEIN